ncbi:MAG: helix-turn-helix domain-containing protein [Bryobacteraceae bacterium]
MTVILPEIECVTAERRAAVLLDPLRLRILREAREPASATEIAARLGMPRQKVNYHVRELARARFLRRAGDRRKRNLIERRYQATARAYVLSPEILGPLRADARQVADAFSAAYLLALASESQAELGRAIAAAQRQGKRLATLSVSAELRFESAAQRAGFTRALEQAIADVIGRHASPATLSGGGAGPGRPYRLVLGCYPITPEHDSKKEQT